MEENFEVKYKELKKTYESINKRNDDLINKFFNDKKISESIDNLTYIVNNMKSEVSGYSSRMMDNLDRVSYYIFGLSAAVATSLFIRIKIE
jgi:hypothetical protein